MSPERRFDSTGGDHLTTPEFTYYFPAKIKQPHTRELIRITATANEKLLLAIIKQNDVKVDAASTAAELGCTTRAVQEQLKKLKRKQREEAGEPANGDATPEKSTGKNGIKTPKKRSAPKASDDGDDANGEEELDTPTKKRRAAKPKTPAKPRVRKGKQIDPPADESKDGEEDADSNKAIKPGDDTQLEGHHSPGKVPQLDCLPQKTGL